MKIVCTSDTHFPFDTDMFPAGDVLIHAGDLMYNGRPEEWMPRLASLREAGRQYKERYIVPGNHDFHIQNYEGVAVAELRKEAKFRTVGLANPFVKVMGKISMMGVPWVPNLRGWAFCRDEEWIYDWMNNHCKAEYVTPQLVVSHGPPHGIRDAIRPEQPAYKDQDHVGSFGMRRWLNEQASEKKAPQAWVCGHIHESYGEEWLDDVRVVNAAMCDREYEQTNPPLVIEL